MSLLSRIARIAALVIASLIGPGTAFAAPGPVSSPMPVHGMPKILSVDLPLGHDFHAGQTVRGSVTTSPNVGYVEARIQYHNAPLQRVGMGRFTLDYRIPWWLPPWLRHGWTLQIIARSIDGVEVKQNYPIRVR